MILFISVIIVLLDLCFKNYVISNLQSGEELITFIPFLRIVKVKNYGIAFGFFKNRNLVVIILTLLIISFLLFLIFKKKIKGTGYILAFCFILGGAFGNLIDRVFYGFVIDYLKITFFPPVCNLSDYMICFGAIIFIFCYAKEYKNK